MSSSAPSRVFAIAVAAAGLAVITAGCSTDDGSPNPFTQTAAGTTSTSGASTGTAGSSATAAGSNGMGGSGAGGTPSATAGSSTAAGSGIGGGAAGTAGVGGVGGAGVVITKAWPSDACGKGTAAPAAGKHTIMTSGTKAADCAAKLPGNILNGAARCGDWGKATSTWQPVTGQNEQQWPAWDPKTPLPRDYWIIYPENYDSTKAYPLVLQGPGCGSPGSAVYSYTSNANNSVIVVGISPPHRSVGHGSNPGEGCFDDKEGDDSVDWVLYETLYDELNNTMCFDRNRLFSGGNSSGAWFSNELGCKYAGDPTRPVRGIMPNTGGLPDQPAYKPTCTDKPMSGIWIHSNMDGTNPFAGNKYAIARAMLANKCTMGNNYDNAPKVQFPDSPSVCKLLQGCPELYPLVVCEINADDHDSHNDIVNPGVSTYLQLFQSGAFLTQ